MEIWWWRNKEAFLRLDSTKSKTKFVVFQHETKVSKCFSRCVLVFWSLSSDGILPIQIFGKEISARVFPGYPIRCSKLYLSFEIILNIPWDLIYERSIILISLSLQLIQDAEKVISVKWCPWPIFLRSTCVFRDGNVIIIIIAITIMKLFHRFSLRVS